MVAAIRQIATASVVGGTITATFGLPILGTSRCAAFINTRGNPSTITRASWNMDAGVVVTPVSSNDQHMAGWVTAGPESGRTSLDFGGTRAGGGQLVALELSGVGDPRQLATTNQNQNAQPCVITLPGACLDGSLILGLYCVRAPDGVGQSGTPGAGWTESLENTPSAGGLHPWDYVASQVAVGAGTYSPTMTSVYNWVGDFGAGFGGTAIEFPPASGQPFFGGDPGGAVWFGVHDRDDAGPRSWWARWRRRRSGLLVPA